MSEEEVKVVCFVCKKSGEDIIMFSEETLKRCQNILKLRKIHKLKYKDIILPSEYTESGYHRTCYKAFTGLMKKYFSSEPLSSEKTTYEPVNNGWILEDDHYQFKWFEGDQLPNYVSESLKTVSEAGEEDDVDNDESREWSSSDDENEDINYDDNEED
ncbi:uncharacterized protein LOC121740251 [Aricia agestis]|uniref:uncharacterized protein LOC121740251 n=1 Tax=Aricia agestis TaxID=91739 RepID=UPI001C208E17|nr:uncharacterized protein LOC121740251 [Aricia agestis]